MQHKILSNRAKAPILWSELIWTVTNNNINNNTLCLKKNPCDYVFDDNLDSKRPIVIIFGTVIT